MLSIFLPIVCKLTGFDRISSRGTSNSLGSIRFLDFILASASLAVLPPPLPELPLAPLISLKTAELLTSERMLPTFGFDSTILPALNVFLIASTVGVKCKILINCSLDTLVKNLVDIPLSIRVNNTDCSSTNSIVNTNRRFSIFLTLLYIVQSNVME